MTQQQHWGDVFTNEDRAIQAFRTYRIRNGVVCKKCTETKHYWLSEKNQFQCSSCKFRTTIRSGTLLEGSKLPITYFFIAWSLIIEKERHVTIKEFQQSTQHKYYEPLWEFLEKIRVYFKHQDNQKMIKDFIEVTQTEFQYKNRNN